MRKLCLITVSTLVACLGIAQAPPAATPDLNTILDKMEQVQSESRTRFRPYVVTRQYQLFSKEGDRPSSEVIADVTFQPPDQKQYQIRQATGSGSGERVVRKVLDREAEMTRQPETIEISRNNYDFALLRTEQLQGSPVFVLELRPKRADKSLLKGLAYVDANTYHIRRLAGHPAKNPSWLIKDLQLTLVFGDVQGMWLQTASEAIANVRFVGKHIFTAHDVSLRTTDQVAQLRRAAPAKRRARTAAVGLGAGVLR